jgi:hypothetical protein
MKDKVLPVAMSSCREGARHLLPSEVLEKSKLKKKDICQI